MADFSRLEIACLGGYDDGADNNDVNDVDDVDDVGDVGCCHHAWDSDVVVRLDTVDACCWVLMLMLMIMFSNWS